MVDLLDDALITPPVVHCLSLWYLLVRTKMTIILYTQVLDAKSGVLDLTTNVRTQDGRWKMEELAVDSGKGSLPCD